jgi:hypothetical protein
MFLRGTGDELETILFEHSIGAVCGAADLAAVEAVAESLQHVRIIDRSRYFDHTFTTGSPETL